MMRHNNYVIEKKIALFSIYLMLSLTFVTAGAAATPREETARNSFVSSLANAALDTLNFLLPSVAAQDNCCIRTTNNAYCVDDVDANDCDVPLEPGQCFNAQECHVGTCVQQNGDCDAMYTNQKCKDNRGFWIDKPLLEINACTPTCCVYKDEGNIADSEFVFFRNKCEKLPQAEDDELDWEEQDINYAACQRVVPETTQGYCTIEEAVTCTYTSKKACDDAGGDFSNQRCDSCQENFEQECHTGDQGYGIYNFDSCGGPGTILNNCGVNQICEDEDEDGDVECVDKVCEVDIDFTNLGYDTAHLKANQVEVEDNAGSRILSPGDSLILSQGEQACIRFQGPGEQHYKTTCMLGELLVFGVNDQREEVCTFSNGRADQEPNNYNSCTDSGKGKHDILGSEGLVSRAFSFLGADLLDPEWWNYWVINPGLSDKSSCESNPYCIEGANNDCVPKYPPATMNLCNDCSTTKASSPWGKCGEATQCTSRGYCGLSENKMDPMAVVTVCTAETLAQQAFALLIRKGAEKSELQKYLEETRDGMAKEIDAEQKGYGGTLNNIKTKGPSTYIGWAANALSALASLPFRFVTSLFNKGTKGLSDKDLGEIKTKLDQKKALEKPGLNWLAGLDFLTSYFGGNNLYNQLQQDKGLLELEEKIKGEEKKLKELEEGNEERKKEIARLEKENKDASEEKRRLEINKQKVTQTQKRIERLVKERVELDRAKKRLKEQQKDDIEQLKRLRQNKAAPPEAGAERYIITIGEGTFDTTTDGQKNRKDLANILSGISTTRVSGAGDIVYTRTPYGNNYLASIAILGTPNQVDSIGGGLSANKNLQAFFNKGVGELSPQKYNYMKDRGRLVDQRILDRPSLEKLSESYKRQGYSPAPSLDGEAPLPASKFPKVGKAFRELGTVDLTPSQYYGGLYYFPVRQEKEAHSIGYRDALENWWKAQGGIGGLLLHQFKSFGKGALVGYMLNVVLGEKYSKTFSKTSTQYWISQAVCNSLSGVGVTSFFGRKICENNALVPILSCTLQTYIHSNVLSNNACLPIGAQGMPGVAIGFNNCEVCQTDQFPCTSERCRTLSADSSCVYDPYEKQCFPDPEKLKACDQTKNTGLSIDKINGEKLSSSNIFIESDISYEYLGFEIEVKTNIAAECKFSVNKTEGIANMERFVADKSYKYHNITLDMSDFTRENFTYFVLCQDICRLQEFSEIMEVNLQKSDKPDEVGPVILNKFPEPDTPIEGGPSGERELAIKIETDENAECKYKRWPLAEGIDSFVGELSQIESIASNLLGAGASEQTLESELSLTGLEWDDANLTDVGVLGQFTKEHEVRFEGSNALNNDEIYAYVFLCRDEKANLGEIPGIIRFKVSELFDVEIKEPDETTVESKPIIKANTERTATCRYSIENKLQYSEMNSFTTTGGTNHKTVVNKLLSFGEHKIYVSCLDEDGFNIATDETVFAVVKDSSAPKIVRAYKDGSTLLISTDELTSCQYSFKGFVYGEGSDMTGNNPVAVEHRAEWRSETNYRIVCRDRFGNTLSTSLKTTKSISEDVF